MEEITLTAAQAAERALSIRLGFLLFIVIAVCVTVWAIITADRASKCSLARSEALKLQVHDNNRKERQEWIAANTELAAQVEQLNAVVADLTHENDRMRDIRKERQEWIAANTELAAQVEQLNAVVADLTHENDRMRDILKVVKFVDVKKMQEQEGKK